MSIDFTEAEQNLRSFIASANEERGSLNEATTRLRYIDRLFFDCLGWDKDDCVVEERLEGRYADYSFKAPSRLLIVEAKKEGVYFDLPAGSSGVTRNISYFSRNAPDVARAIAQAMQYCQSSGTPYGAVCNGHQLVAFVASRSDGRAPADGIALVLDSLEALLANFLLTWQCLSKPGVTNRGLSLQLLDEPVVPVPQKLAGSINGYPGFKRRNALQTDLQILSDLFIEDIASLGSQGDVTEFLRACYCHSGALSQYATVSKQILRTRYSGLFLEAAGAPDVQPATLKRGPNPQLTAQALSRRPILLIGDRGVGKTMFIRHLYKVEAPDIFENAIVLYIDYGSKPAVVEQIERFTADEITRQLLEHAIDVYERGFVTGVLNLELQRFAKGIYGELRETSPEAYSARRLEFIEEHLADKDEYLKEALNHISRARQKQVVVFLDNVDQRPDDFQERSFLIGQSMAANWPVTVFVSIRPETYYRSRLSGTLSAYQARAFTVSPPRVDEALAKRLDYGIELLEGGVRLPSTGEVSVQLANLTDYLQVLRYSFRSSKWLIEFLDNVCGGNIRLAMDFLRAFIGSGHVDTEKILRIYRRTGDYLVPLHEFLRAVTYGDHEHFYPAGSEIMNVLDISAPDGREHFLAPLLLAQLDRWAQSSDRDGFVETDRLFEYAQDRGFAPEQIGWHLERMLRRNLVESPWKVREYDPAAPPPHYRVTAVGTYYAKRLISRFAYIDAMIVDTPIVSREVRADIRDAHTLEDRLHRASLFCGYLDDQWEALGSIDAALDWPLIRRELQRDIDYVTGKIALREDVLDSASS